MSTTAVVLATPASGEPEAPPAPAPSDPQAADAVARVRDPEPSFESPRKKRRRKHTLDEAFFRVIDTEDKAYWFGFLLADGWIRDNRSVSLELATCDIDHLKRLRSAVGASYPTPERKNRASASLTLCSVALVDDLKSLGMLPNKTYAGIAWPHGVPPHLVSHFLRGYMDGNGCISVTMVPRKDGTYRQDYLVKFDGPNDFIKAVQAHLRALCGLGPVAIHGDGPDGTFTYTGNLQVARILRFLYPSGTTVCLPRKMAIARRLLGPDFCPEANLTVDEAVRAAEAQAAAPDDSRDGVPVSRRRGPPEGEAEADPA